MLGGPRYKTIFVQPNGRQMAKIAALLGEGKLKVHVSKTFRLEHARWELTDFWTLACNFSACNTSSQEGFALEAVMYEQLASSL